MKAWKKFKSFVSRIWKDPVWSKVIAAFFIFAIPIGWAKITNHSWSEIYNYSITILSFKIPLFVFLSAIALFFIIVKSIQLYRSRSNAFWNEKIGNYTFKELHNILLTETLPIQTQGMQWGFRNAPADNLMILFETYYMTLSTGFGFYDNIHDGGYLYGVFAPRMIGYGLVEDYQEDDPNLPGQKNKAYRISALGHKFHASLDKLRLQQKIKEIKSRKKVKKN